MIGREYHNYIFTVYKCPPVRDVSAPPTPCMEQESAPLRRNERSFLGHQLSSGLPMSSRGPFPAGRFQHIPSVSFGRSWFARDFVPQARQDQDAGQDAGNTRGQTAGRDPQTRRNGCFANQPHAKISFDTGTKVPRVKISFDAGTKVSHPVWTW